MPRTRPALDLDAIVDAALALADAEGLAACTMRGVARQLGVEAMSLYHHVANKDALLDAMVDRVFGEIARPDPAAGDWREQLAARCRSMRAVLARHAWANGLLESRTSPGPGTLGHHDAVLGTLRAGGFPIRQAGHAVALLDAYVYGFATQEQMLPFDDDTGAAEVATDIVGADLEAFAAAYPHLAEMVVEVVQVPGYDFADEFDVGLELVLDAVATLLGPA